MADFRNQILIVDDEPVILSAMKEAFKRAGFAVHATSKAAEARSLLKTNPIGTAFVDCLMSDEGGVELVESLRAQFPAEILDVVLMSGVFVDPGFIKETLRSTQAIHFLKKPFAIEDALNLVDPSTSDRSANNSDVQDRKKLYSFLSKSKLTAREKKKIIESLDEIHGFDLPFIYNLLVESKTSGHLNVASKAGDVFGISFAQGHIVAVDIPDKGTYLGKLLVDAGFVTEADMQAVVNEKSGRKLGERLTENYVVSPHAVSQAISHQMSLRLSKTIVDRTLTINFVEADVELIEPFIAPAVFAKHLHDWIVSKISLTWLRAHFLQWTTSAIVQSAYFRDDHPALEAPLVLALPNLLKELLGAQSLGQLLDSKNFSEEPFLKAVHFLCTRGILAFTTPVRIVNQVDRLSLLRKLKQQLDGKNKWETLETIAQIVGGSLNQPEIISKDFEKLLGSKPTSDEAELLALYDGLLVQGKAVFELAKKGNLEKMREEVAKEVAESKLKTVSLVEEAKAHLLKGSYSLAMPLLAEARKLDPKADRLRLYFCWAETGLCENAPDGLRRLENVEMEMLQVPPEEKLEASFSFIQGLIAKIRGDYATARRLIEKSMVLDKNMMVAKRELSLLANKSNKAASTSNSVFDKDLKEVFGSMFRKKSG